MSGKHSRNKGASFERYCCKKFGEVFDNPERSLSGSSADQNGIDLRGTGRFLVQCKRYRGYAPISKIGEIKEPDGIRCLVTKADRQPAIVCLELDDFIAILKNPEIINEDYDLQRRFGESNQLIH